MNLTIKKNEIKRELDKIEDEKVVWAIARLLRLDDDGDVSQWHKDLVKERTVKYGKKKNAMKDWEEVQKGL